MARKKGGEIMAEQKKGSSGLDQNVAAMLCYLAGWVTGVIFLLIEKDNKFVKFHAIQSILTFGVLSVLIWLIVPVLLPVIGFGILTLSWILWILWLVLWILLMVKAYQGQEFKLPIIGDMAMKWAGK